MKKLYFLFGVHNHQPVGNFPHVFDRAYKLAYSPFIKLMQAHPGVKWTLHCSGILWDYFEEKRPEYLNIVRKLIGSGQVELLTGGYYEPILSILPDRDKLGQVNKLTEFIREKFNFQPRGAWLAERIWEGSLAKILKQSNLEYTILDDHHFISNGLSKKDLNGYYITEEQGHTLKIFSISETLRYSIPWRPVQDTIEYFKTMAAESDKLDNPTDNPCVVMIDDGEKFGLWPGTNRLVYTSRWLDKFLTAIEQNSDWLKTLTFSEFVKTFPARGRVYLAPASYFEMTQWSLPHKAQSELEDVLEELEHLPGGERIKKFIHGGIWQNFLVKYPDANNMHKKMLYVSNKIDNFKDTTHHTKALDSLYAGQCNCAYWHGVFGGLYLPHLRLAIYKKLIRAETLLNKEQKSDIELRNIDFDCDGKQEIILETNAQNLYIRPHSGGTIFEWDIKGCGVNLLGVITRYKETYHDKLAEIVELKKKKLASGISAALLGLYKSKGKKLIKYVHHDFYNRVSLIDHFFHKSTKLEDFYRCQYIEQGDFIQVEYDYDIIDERKENGAMSVRLAKKGHVLIEGTSFALEVRKTVTFSRKSEVVVNYEIINHSDLPIALWHGVEFNLVAGSKSVEKEEMLNKKTFEKIYRDENFKIKFDFSLPKNIWIFPVETVSLSDRGFERTCQGACVLFHENFKIQPHKSHFWDMSFGVC